MNVDFIRQVGVVRWAIRYGTYQFRKRVLRRDHVFKLPTGRAIRLYRSSPNSGAIYVTNANVDWGSEALLAEFADPSRDFLDVGAHIGYYASYLSPRVRRCYAFEPDPRNLEPLRANAELAGNVEIVPVAVSSRDGEARLHLWPGTSVSSLEGAGEGSIAVPTCSIDSFVARRPGIDVAIVKTDVEGHDLQALIGARDTVRRFQPLILTECQDSAGIADLCSAWQYGAFAITRDRRTLTLRLERLDPSELAAHWFAMLFLVPPKLVPRFEERAAGFRA